MPGVRETLGGCFSGDIRERVTLLSLRVQARRKVLFSLQKGRHVSTKLWEGRQGSEESRYMGNPSKDRQFRPMKLSGTHSLAPRL